MSSSAPTPKPRQVGQWANQTETFDSAPTSPDVSRPPSPTGRHAANGNGHSHAKPRPHTQKTPLYKALKKMHANLDERLKEHSSSDTLAGFAARKLLIAGAWAEDRLEEELEHRASAISGTDNLFYLLTTTDTNFNPVCTATYTLDSPVTFDEYVSALKRLIKAYPRYGQKLQDVGRRLHGARFVDDPDFKFEDHLTVVELPEPAGPRELEDFTGKFIALPWDLSRPLWRAVILPNYVDPETGAHGAMTLKGHHAIADGQGFVQSQLSMTSFGQNMAEALRKSAAPPSSARRGTPKPSKLHKSLQPLDKYAAYSWMQSIMMVLYSLVFAFHFLLEAYGSIYQVVLTGTIWSLTFWRQRYATTYQRGDVLEKEFSASKAFPLENVKRMQRAFSGPQPGSWAEWLSGDKARTAKSTWNHLTLNDILCTVISDVIADELDSRGRGPGLYNRFLNATDLILPNPIGLFIPISVRPKGDYSLQNYSTGAFAYLPVGKGLPTSVKAMYSRLHANRNRLSVVKHRFFPYLGFEMLQMTGHTPIVFPAAHWTPVKSIVRWWTEIILSSFSAVVTNVPGPTVEMSFEGHKVHRWTALPPQAGKQTLGIGIITYNNTICVSIAADHVAGTEGVARRMTANFERRWQQYLDVADVVLGKDD